MLKALGVPREERTMDFAELGRGRPYNPRLQEKIFDLPKSMSGTRSRPLLHLARAKPDAYAPASQEKQANLSENAHREQAAQIEEVDWTNEDVGKVFEIEKVAQIEAEGHVEQGEAVEQVEQVEAVEQVEQFEGVQQVEQVQQSDKVHTEP